VGPGDEDEGGESQGWGGRKKEGGIQTRKGTTSLGDRVDHCAGGSLAMILAH
jgi:hypothetical protein